MLDRKTKDILNNYKDGNYDLHKIKQENENRIDNILFLLYGDVSYLQYYQIFCYLNDVVYPLDELTVGRYLKKYNLDEIDIMLKANNIDISEQMFK